MGKTIFITEKPSVAQNYKDVLQVKPTGKTDGYIEGHSSVIDKDVIITWAVGHLISIAEPANQNEAWAGSWNAKQLPMIPEKFKYSPLANTYKQYQIVKSLYTRSDVSEIYYAGDSGREGIYIQALIRNQIFKSAPKITEKVVWIDSFTEEAILNGIKTAKPYSTYQPMIDSGYMRAISDWLIGMNFTRSFSITSGGARISVGRVMTPTLAMIVKRQEEIDNFTKTPYFEIKADDFAGWKAVEGSRFFESDLLYNESGFSKRADAENLLTEFNGDKSLTVSDVKVQKKTEYAPLLYNLADLQAKCTRAFRISPADTLKIAQVLYENKYTTYPRTDCRYLSSAVAADLKGKGYDIPDRYVDDSKITDHYALIPTLQGDVSKIENLEKEGDAKGLPVRKVYEVILKRFSDIMLPPYIYNAVSITYSHGNKEKFFESYRQPIQLGFKEKQTETEEEKEDRKETEKDEEKVVEKPVPNVGDKVSVTEFKIKEAETKPPVAYTTGSLVTAMEKAGKFIDDEELRNQIKSSGIGTSATRAGIIQNLEKKGFISVDKKQKVAPTEFGKQVIPLIAKYDEALISPIKTADMETRLNAIASGEVSVDEYRKDIESYVRATVGNIIENNKEHISGGQGQDAQTYKCPICGKDIKHGKYGWFCSDQESCKFNLHAEVLGSKMTEKDIKGLSEKGKTSAHQFTSKEGKKFKAMLVVDKAKHSTKFEFVNDNKKK